MFKVYSENELAHEVMYAQACKPFFYFGEVIEMNSAQCMKDPDMLARLQKLNESLLPKATAKKKVGKSWSLTEAQKKYKEESEYWQMVDTLTDGTIDQKLKAYEPKLRIKKEEKAV